MERWGMAQVPELRNFYYESAGSLTRILVYLMSWISLRVFSGLRKTVAEELELGKRPAEFMRRFLAGWNQMEGRFGRFTAEVYQRLAPGRSVERFYRKRVLAAAFAAVTGSLWCVVYGSRGGGIVCWLTVWLLVVPAASFLPYVDLMIAGIFYPDQAETEVSLYRFVTLCLSRVSTMTVERILERMELFGFYFQAEVSEWLDRGLVLPETLSDKGWQSDIPESLRELLRNFLAADRVGLKEIGKNVALQRDFQLARDRQRLELSAGKREAWIQLILFLPFGTAVAAYLILPFLGQGMNSLMSFTGGGIM